MKAQKNLYVRCSGNLCPIRGIWQSCGRFITTIIIAKGQKLPPYCGYKTTWKLITRG